MKNSYLIQITLILVFCFSSLHAQTIVSEKLYVDSMLMSNKLDTYEKDDLRKKWSIFSAEYSQINIPMNKLTGEIDFMDKIRIDSLDKKTIFQRCEQWMIMNYFQIFYSNLEAGKLMGTASATVSHKSEKISFGEKSYFPVSTTAEFTIILTIKDNRLKYEIVDIKHNIDTEGEPTSTLKSFLPLISHNRSYWYLYLSFVEELQKKLMIDSKRSLVGYIEGFKTDYDF